jgi:excisionase family DNA binding protein
MPDLLTPAEAANLLGISVRTLRAHVRSGELAFINVGRGQVRKHIAFTRQDLEDFIKSRRMRQGAAEPVRRAMRARQAEPIGLDFAALRAKRKEERRRK